MGVKDWFINYLKHHGERWTFMLAALAGAIIMINMGGDKLTGAGETVCIGIVMLLFNKARGSLNGMKGNETNDENK